MIKCTHIEGFLHSQSGQRRIRQDRRILLYLLTTSFVSFVPMLLNSSINPQQDQTIGTISCYFPVSLLNLTFVRLHNISLICSFKVRLIFSEILYSSCPLQERYPLSTHWPYSPITSCSNSTVSFHSVLCRGTWSDVFL